MMMHKGGPAREPAPVLLAALIAGSLALGGCRTASLEDAAPAGALPEPVVAAGAPSSSTQPAAIVATAPAGQAQPAAAESSTVIRRNPGIVSVIPLEQTVDPERPGFVAEGARDTGAYPKIGVQPETANTQMTAAEKYEQEARMLEILRSRERNPVTRAGYDRRVAELRRLARTHASAVEQQIEN